MQRLVLVGILLLLDGLALAKSSTNMAEELVKLRAEVETLHNELESLRTDKKSRVQSTHLRINDLEAQIQREEVAVAKSQEKLSQIEKEKAAKQTSGVELIPVVQSALKATETSIIAGAPFRQTERVQSVKDIEKTLASSPVKALMLITVVAAIAPLLGLLGTVTGMIATFDIITEFGTGNPKLLSGGISEALVTTMFGLIVAIPALFFGHLLAGWSSKIKGKIEHSALTVINANAQKIA